MTEPLVSIALPVRNGAAGLEDALASLAGQSFRDLEIIVSDNASTDDTAAILARWQAQEPRLRVIRQPQVIPMMANFAAVLAATRGRYVAFAAHDDTRAPDFIAGLLPALQEDDRIVLSFGDVLEITETGQHRPVQNFESRGLSPAQRLRRTAREQCYHFYGVWRGDVLRRLPMVDIPWWPDLPVMLAGAALGPFRHVPGVLFTYHFRPRWFFAKGRGGGGGWLSALILGRLIWHSARAVAQVAGWRLGWVAGLAVTGKVGRQVLTWFRNRLGSRA